jgi:hypothetical protein
VNSAELGDFPCLEITCSPNIFTATLAIDYETDAVIQNSLRTNLGPEITLFTIAQRLQTIMDGDKTVGHLGCLFLISDR